MNSPLIRWLLDLDAIPAGAEDVHLTWANPFAAWMWALMIAGAAALAVWSYRRLVGPRPVRLALAAVRCAIIILILVVISGPMLELPRENVEEDWVLVLADRSESMTIADAQRNGERESRNAQLQRLFDEHHDMWRELSEVRHVVWLGFHRGAFDLQQRSSSSDSQGEDHASNSNQSSNQQSAKPQAAGGDIALGPPDGDRTRIATAIEQALHRAAARPLSGVVLFSDGRTTDPPSRRLLNRLQAEAVPVFSVPVGSADAIGDLAVRRVEAPQRAFVRDKVPVVVDVDQLGSQDTGEVTIRLVDETTGETLDEQTIQPGERTDDNREDDTQTVTLIAEPEMAGEASWRVVIDTPEPDLIEGNNTRSFAVQLIDRPLRVLLIEGYPRWEYRYLKNLLVREQSIESSVFLVSADPDFAQEGNKPITRLPRSPEEFAEFDVIVLGDVPAGFFSPRQLEMMRDHVAERGAGVLWIAGQRSLPISYTDTAIVDLLPISAVSSVSSIGQPVNMQPTPLADQLGVLRLLSSGQTEPGWPVELADPSYGWSQLYWAQRLAPNRLKPTAEPLAETVQQFNGQQLPLVVHMRYGAGQSIYVASDEIWRWRYGRGERLPEQFWVQMIRMLGRESLSTGDEQAVLEAAPRRVEVGQPVRLTLRLLDEQFVDPTRETIRAVVTDADGENVADVELEQQPNAEARYAATIIADQPGSLTVRVDDPAEPNLQASAPLDVFAPEDELRYPETDHDLLADLSEATGGRVLSEGNLAQLPELLPNRAVRTLNPLTERIWDTPLFFALVLLLLTAEWVGRKVIRLA